MSELHISESNTTSPSIDFDLLDRWIEALRSGKYMQTEGHLRRGNGYCCLGVLCDISGIGSWRPSEIKGGYEFVVTKNNAIRDGDLPYDLMNVMGFVTGFADRLDTEPWVTFSPDLEEGLPHGARILRLSELNDEWGYDFNQIAELLEKYRDDLKATHDETAA